MSFPRILDTGAIAGYLEGSLYLESLLFYAERREIPVLVPAAVLTDVLATADPRDRIEILNLLMHPAIRVEESNREAATVAGCLLADHGEDSISAGYVVEAYDRLGWQVVTRRPDVLFNLNKTIDVETI